MIGWGITNEAQKIQKTNQGLLRNKNGFQKQKDSLSTSDIDKDWKYKEASAADLENIREKLKNQRKSQVLKSTIIFITAAGLVTLLLMYMLGS